MTLGLPGHLARASLSRALTHAGHCAAWVCLAVTVALGVSGATIDGDPMSWAVVTIAALLAILLVFVARHPIVSLTVLYLVIGAAAMVALTTIVMDAGLQGGTTNTPILALPMIAILLVGGAGTGAAIAITWAGLGYALGEAATFLGATLVGANWVPNAGAASAFVLVVVIRALDGISRRSDQRRETGLHRASQQNRELAIRHDYELRATARLHDTALSHLVAIAAAGSGPVDERLRTGIRQDLGLIVGRDWAVDHSLPDEAENLRGGAGRGRGYRRPGVAAATVGGVPGGSAPADVVEAEGSAFRAAFTAAANAALRVRWTGDSTALRVLGPMRAEALDAAVAQCLINVARHAGVDEAEVAVGVGSGEVTVAVMDSGVGFDEHEIPEDRIGLRTSIRARIEHEGGTVRLWSTKGIGTTIVLTVPEGGE